MIYKIINTLTREIVAETSNQQRAFAMAEALTIASDSNEIFIVQ